MQKPPIKYNPAFLSDEELAKAFVVRHDDLNLIMTVIRENTGDSNQHVLVIGPRGIGKTMCVLRAALEVRKDNDLSRKWYPLVFAEESYEVGTAGEFWLESLFHLGRQTRDPRWAQTYNDLKREPDDDRLRERALAQLLDFADTQGRRILLIVENLNMILSGQISDDDAWKLRGTLMHESRLMLLATAMTQIDLPEHMRKSGNAMFELFKSHFLKPLNNEESQSVWQSIAGYELGGRRIRAVTILTGGNPRLLAIISQFGAHLSFSELMEEMTGLVDEHTDYFKSHLESLPPTERKVYVALADLWDPSTARQVADAARLEVSMTSSFLKRLTSRGAVIELPGKGRTKHYRVSERLYNIYYLMRRRGTPSERVKAIVQFMVQFYEEIELVEVAKHLTEEACHLPCRDRTYHYYAFEGILKTTSPELRSKILQGISRDFFETIDTPDSLRQLLKETDEATCPCQPQKHPDARINDLMKKGNKASGDYNKEEAVRFFHEVLDIDSTYSLAWILLGRVLIKLPDKKGETEQAFRKATEVAPSNPCGWDALGSFLSKENDRQIEAEKAFRKALEIYPDCCHAWIGLARLAGKEQEGLRAYHEAEEACMRLTQQYPDRVQHWKMLAFIRHNFTRHFSDAEVAYRKAIELNPKDAETYMNLGNLLHYNLKKYIDAETAYRKAIELNPKLAGALGGLGQLLRDHLNKIDEAKEIFQKIIEIGSNKTHFALVELGLLYKNQGNYQEAETVYRKAIELNPKSHTAWFNLGIILHEKLERHVEAEAAYQKAIELDPKHTCPRIYLIKLVLTGLKQPDRALGLAKQSIKDVPDNAALLNGLAWNFFEYGLPDHLAYAEEWARQAVVLEKIPEHIHTLACVLAREEKADEALQLTHDLLNNPEFTGKQIEDMVILFTELIKAGAAKDAYRALHDSQSAIVLEPIVVALQKYMGMEVRVAPEISDVADDVLKRFQEELCCQKTIMRT